MWHLDPLHYLFRVSPRTGQIFRDNIRAAKLGRGIQVPEFQSQKKRILVLHHLLENIKGLNGTQMWYLADEVLNRQDTPTILGILNSFEKGNSGYWGRLKTTVGISDSWAAVVWKDANQFASSVPDSRFLSDLEATTFPECLRDATAEAENAAYTCLTTQIESLVAGITAQILSVQKSECEKQIQREVRSSRERELRKLRSKFVRQIEASSRERSRSYVRQSLALIVKANNLIQHSCVSIYVTNFTTQKERYHSQGPLANPARSEVISSSERVLLYHRPHGSPARPRD